MYFSLGADEDLEGSPCVHVLVALRYLVEGDFTVEDPAGVDLAAEDARHKGLDIGAGGCGSAGEGDVGAEEAAEADRRVLVLWDADSADHAAGADDADCLFVSPASIGR